ncbi:hypothetical protein DFH28DRAFT_1125340 [Melampsora americana]|nr:hypothetical protein DFH28DRAFT_1125340 [Melampsora americana]
MIPTYFIQHTHVLNLGDIPSSVDTVFADFFILAPLTSCQENLHYCTHYIKQTIGHHAAHPGSPKPFALWYPNIIALNNLAIERSRSPIIVGKDQAVILRDVANQAVAAGVPPKESPFSTTPSAKIRGLLASVSAETVTNVGVFHGPVTKAMEDGCTIKPFEVHDNTTSCLNGADSIQLQWPGTLTGVLPYQAVGYGQILSLATGMFNTKMGLGKARQGHPNSNWQDNNVGKFNLPTLIQMGEEHAYKRETNSRVESEVVWHNKQARLLVKAFQPASYAAAMKACSVIVKKGSPGVGQTLAALVNPLGIGRHTMFGMQVDYHRDGSNAPLFASANYFGEHYGGGE